MRVKDESIQRSEVRLAFPYTNIDLKFFHNFGDMALLYIENRSEGFNNYFANYILIENTTEEIIFAECEKESSTQMHFCIPADQPR